MNGGSSVFDWLANLPFVSVLAIAVALYALHAATMRTKGLPERVSKGFGEFVESLLFAWVVVFLLLKPFLIQAFYIPSESMEPTLGGHIAGDRTPTGTPPTYPDSEHDRLLVAKFPFWFSGPHRGDILVFKAPPNADQQGIERDYIKRCIGLPGEKLEVRGEKVYINDQALNEQYPVYDENSPPPHPDFGPIVIPKDHYFMMGDNRNHSADSRYWGPLDRHRIVGQAWFRFWPLDRIGLLRHPDDYTVPAQPQRPLGVVSMMH